MSTINYKIPKVESRVDLLIDQVHKKPEEYVIYLSEFSRYRKGPETVFEFLNKEKHFIPLKESGTGTFVITNIEQIVYVREQEESQPPAELKRVKIFLSNNNVELTVDHFKPLPDNQSRMLDYLNDKNRFVVFFHNNHKIHINKEKIIKVEEV